MDIRPYQPGDEARMAQYAPRAFGVWARLGIDYSLPRHRTNLAYSSEAEGYARRARAGEGDFAVFVATLDDDVVGHIVVAVNHHWTRIYGFKWGWIVSLAVDPDYHHQGIGSALCARGVQWLRERECRYIEVSTDQNNVAAIRTYEKNGFRVIYSGVTLSQYLD
ncbi:MAG: GNAT family N-acetyltransferase [Armatimonadota bacterium]